MGEFTHRSVGCAHPGSLSRCISHGTIRCRRQRRHPLARYPAEFGDFAIQPDRADAAILATCKQKLTIGGWYGAKQAVMGFHGLVAIVEPMHAAVGKREERDILDKARVNAMAGEV